MRTVEVLVAKALVVGAEGPCHHCPGQTAAKHRPCAALTALADLADTRAKVLRTRHPRPR